MAYKMLDGNAAAAEAIKMARPGVIAVYPITPQTTISERLSEMTDFGELDAQYVRVESEHSAMSVVTAAQLTGVRASTATASQGLILMSEVLGMASGMRLPVVMPVVNRGIAAPWTLWCSHTDTMTIRDIGWMQFYCQNAQEVFDLILAAYRIAEDERVLTPAMVCLDGFFLSHSMQKIDVPAQSEVDDFLGEYKAKNTYLDPEDPMFVCDLTGSDDFTEMRYQQKVAFENAKLVTAEIQKEFFERFGRKLSIVEGYMTDDADVVLVALGSMCGTAKYVVNQMRQEGKKVGLLRIVMFRPFPAELIREALKDVPVIGVFDRSESLGYQAGPVFNEVSVALDGAGCDIRHYIGGLGGRDIPAATLGRIYDELLAIKDGERTENTEWIDVKGNAMEIRQVVKNA